ncbi:MAG: hypothetical protein KGQ59_07065, partial [Bdellovibrionales bacterium]|nr:hypothetical protein [Bdellovibrionales bacterium]
MRSPFWLFITDPWETLDHPRDTTLRLMEESARRKIHVFWANYQSIRLEGPDVLIDSQALSTVELELARKTGQSPSGAVWSTSPKRFTQIHYRVDPPIDLSYLHPLQILNQEARR